MKAPLENSAHCVIKNGTFKANLRNNSYYFTYEKI